MTQAYTIPIPIAITIPTNDNGARTQLPPRRRGARSPP